LQVAALQAENAELYDEVRELRHTCYVMVQEIEVYKRDLWRIAKDEAASDD